MKTNELYIEQVNQFCEANCKVTAEDILTKAKQRQAENVLTETTSQKTDKIITLPSGKKAMFRLSHIVAACLAIFLLTGTTILAFSGKIGHLFGDAGVTVVAFDERKMEFFFRDVLNDETTAELVGKGYLYEINQVQEDENFRIDVIAASGDIDNAKLAVDVYLKDEQLAATNDRIYLIGYLANPGEEPVKDPNGCRVTEAYGTKDETVDNLYHVLLDIDSSNSEVVYCFSTVITTFASDEDQPLYVYDLLPELERNPLWRWHSLDLRFNITIPEEAYSRIINRRYRDIAYHGTTYEYHLDTVEYGSYDTRLIFHFDYDSDFTPSNEEGKTAHERYMATEFNSMLQDAALIVDGTEYKYDNNNLLPWSTCYSGEGEDNTNRCELTIFFPSANYFESESILLRIGEETYDLKESE